MAKTWWTKKRQQNALVIGVCAAAIAVAGFVVWSSKPAAAEPKPLMQAQGMMSVRYTQKPGAILLTPALPAAKWIVLYPDAHVDPAAYAYKMSGLAQSGVAIVIVRPLLNMPQFDSQSFKDFAAMVPDVKEWYMAGHGQGANKACQNAENNLYKGIIVLAAYCTKSIAAVSMPVLVMFGANDGIVGRQSVEQNKLFMPDTAQYDLVEGLNHAGFADYGAQQGDGDVTLTDTEVRLKMTERIAQFIGVTARAE